MSLVRRLEAGELEAFADPLGELVELERAVEHDSGLAVGIPADLALDRAQALDDHDHLLADAIFLDRLDLHSAQGNVVHIDAVIELSNAHRGLAGDLEPRRPRTEAVARLAPRKKLAEIDVLVELDANHVVASPHNGRRNLLRTQLAVALPTDLRGVGRHRHLPACR